MKNNFLKFIKVTNGIFLISILIWLLFMFKSEGIKDLRTLTIVLLSLLPIEIIVLASSILFYFSTKNIITIKEQIKYALIILILAVDLLFLTGGAGVDKSILLFLFALNAFSILYILKDKCL